jgi:hypothetical protein
MAVRIYMGTLYHSYMPIYTEGNDEGHLESLIHICMLSWGRGGVHWYHSFPQYF